MKTNNKTATRPAEQHRHEQVRQAAIDRVSGGGELVGKFFHSITADDIVEWQGVVIGNPEPGWYLLQLFSWLMGDPSNQQLVRIEEMRGWLFYPDGEAMAYSYDYGAAHSRRSDVRKGVPNAGLK